MIIPNPLVAGKNLTSATVNGATTYTESRGELFCLIDTTQLYLGKDPTTAGSILPIATGQATVSLASQTASIATTNLQTPPANGFYRISYYYETTTTDATGTITLTFGWTDDNGAQTSNEINGLALSSTGYRQGEVRCWAKATGNITYAVTLAGLAGTPAFAIRILLERLF